APPPAYGPGFRPDPQADALLRPLLEAPGAGPEHLLRPAHRRRAHGGHDARPAGPRRGITAAMIYELPGRSPLIDDSAFIAPNAGVIGDVRLGADTSVWFGAVLRGDTELITVGACTNVQDGAVLHADPGVPCTLGEGVTVGHMAMVHGCTVGDYSLIGIQAV